MPYVSSGIQSGLIAHPTPAAPLPATPALTASKVAAALRAMPARTASSATANVTKALPVMIGAGANVQPARGSVALVRRKLSDLPAGTSLALPPTNQRVAIVGPGGAATLLRPRNAPGGAMPAATVLRAIPLPKQGVRRSNASLTAAEQSDELGSWLSSAIHGIGHAATQVGHTVGKVVTSKIGQGILGAGLALTGVGLPAAAGIFAATKGVGNLIKPGGNLKNAATGAAQGAIEGATSSLVGKGARSLFSAVKGHGSTPAAGGTTAASGRPSIGVTTAKSIADLPAELTPSAPAIPTQMIYASPTGAAAGPNVLTLPGTLPANPIVPPTAPGTAVRTASQSGAIPGFPSAVLQAGRTGSGAARKGATDARLAAQALAAAAQIAAQSGQTGLASDIANVAGTVANVGSTLQTASGAIQGAATGAVAGAQTSVISQWISAHKGIVYGGAAGVGLLTLLAIFKPRRAA